MRVRAFAVLDSKAKAFLPPFFYHEVGQAQRTFSDAINDPKHVFGTHPEDYVLYEIGLYDDATAKLEPFGPEMVVAGPQCLRDTGDVTQPELFEVGGKSA